MVRLGLERGATQTCAFELYPNQTCYPTNEFVSDSFGLRLCNASELAGIISVDVGTDCYAPPGDDIVNLTANPMAGFEVSTDNGSDAASANADPLQGDLSWGYGGSDSLYTFNLDFSGKVNQSQPYDRLRYLVDRGWFDLQVSLLHACIMHARTHALDP